MLKTTSTFALILTGLLALSPMLAHAVTSAPESTVLTQPDGTKFEAKLKGDEYINWMETVEAILL